MAKLCRTQYARYPDDDPRSRPSTTRPRLAPFLIQCGGAENFAGGIAAPEVRPHGTHEFQLWPDQFHVFQVFHPLVPEAKIAVRDIGSFIRAACAADPVPLPPPAHAARTTSPPRRHHQPSQPARATSPPFVGTTSSATAATTSSRSRQHLAQVAGRNPLTCDPTPWARGTCGVGVG